MLTDLLKFKYKHLQEIETRQDEETTANFRDFINNPVYKDFLLSQAQLYTLYHTIPTTKKRVILCIFGGYRTAPGTAELTLVPSRYFNRNVLKCLKVLRCMIHEKRDEFFPGDVYRLEMNCNLKYPEIVNFGIKGVKFDIVGIRHKFGFQQQEDYILLEKVL